MAPLFRRLCAWTAIFTFSAAIGLGWMVVGHQGPDDDSACRPAAVALNGHSHSTAQFESPQQTTPGTHCPFCHWQRAVGGATAAVIDSHVVTLEPVEWTLTAGPKLPRPGALDAHPSRGPPSIL